LNVAETSWLPFQLFQIENSFEGHPNCEGYVPTCHCESFKNVCSQHSKQELPSSLSIANVWFFFLGSNSIQGTGRGRGCSDHDHDPSFRLFLPGKSSTGGNSHKGICGGDVGGGRGPCAGVGGRSPIGGCHSSCHILHYPLLQPCKEKWRQAYSFLLWYNSCCNVCSKQIITLQLWTKFCNFTGWGFFCCFLSW